MKNDIGTIIHCDLWIDYETVWPCSDVANSKSFTSLDGDIVNVKFNSFKIKLAKFTISSTYLYTYRCLAFIKEL